MDKPMPDIANVTIPYDGLEALSLDKSVYSAEDSISETVLAALLMRTLAQHVSHLAAEQISTLVSTTLDITDDLSQCAPPYTFETYTDRKTRTMVFAGGAARCDGGTIMTATAVYQLAQPTADA